jgi:hypothetical protein
MAILLKTASVRVSSIQIMQIRGQNKGKSIWKSRYDGDLSVVETVTTTSTTPDLSLGSRGRSYSAETSRPSRRPSLGRLPRLGLWRPCARPIWLSAIVWRCSSSHSTIVPTDSISPVPVVGSASCSRVTRSRITRYFALPSKIWQQPLG